jgi:hypothetical protein
LKKEPKQIRLWHKSWFIAETNFHINLVKPDPNFFLSDNQETSYY